MLPISKHILLPSRNTCGLLLHSLTLLLTVSCVAASALPSAHHFTDSRQAEFAKSLKDYEISIPAKVTKDGDHISHSVHHTLEGVHSHVHRRDVTPDPLHYRLKVDGMDLQMTLTPHHRMFAPGLVVERRSRQYGNISDSRILRMTQNPCHFRGQIQGQENSAVAMATCQGLTGLLRTDKGDYFIEPVKGYNHSDDAHHPHLVYRRSALPDDMHISGALHHEHKDHQHDGTCGVAGDVKDIEKEREEWQKAHVPEQPKEHSHSRHKRSYSRERNVETLVVVDTKMVEYYESEDLENYVLTIMNMVATLYHDSTIGNAVNIVLVRLILLENEETNLKITHHADNTLNSFCRWQNDMNPPDDAHPNHHDVAVLLTRYNICSRMNEPCSTLGLSQVSGLCQSHRSCNINEDTGLALAYTIAHELGHNFGMHHDTQASGCELHEGSAVQYVMSPQLSVKASPLIWSNCSRLSITKFLDRDWGYCLNDEPSPHEFAFPVLPPGVMYDINHQCRLQYGPDAQYCNGIGEICSTLWCQVDNKCMSRLEAAAHGTICGDNNWCVLGHCEVIGESPEAINGQWGVWSSWSQCSRSCGAGVAFSERHCDNPPPSNGGNYCLGERKRYRICNTDACEEGGKTFRQVQCEEFNTVPYKNRLYEWEAVYTPGTPCQLHCKPKDRFFSLMLRDMVTDGTPCNRGSRDMCISGICKKVGCDWIINSTAKEDHCGVCHGDGTTCKTIKDHFSEEKGLGYVEAMAIPAGARNIRVNEVAEANNYLAIKNDQGKFYLNGDWYIQWSGDYEAAGTIIHYNREGNKESFSIPGPLKEKLHILLLFQSTNPGVTFEYVVPNENQNSSRIPEFSWKYMDWTHCTASCGGGYQRREVVCVEKEAGIVDSGYCNKSTKPDDELKSCNDHLCPARWWTGPWQHCSATCGTEGARRRTVICIRSQGPDEQIALDDFFCEDLPRPSDMEACRHKAACPDEMAWKPGPWEGICNGDPCEVQTRTVKCNDPNAICDTKTMPPSIRKCTATKCGNWTVGDWSECTRTCGGGGVQYRSVTCTGADACHLASQPPDVRSCNEDPCVDQPWSNSNAVPAIAPVVNPATNQVSNETNVNNTASIYKWDEFSWGECSKPCGLGVMKRKLVCVTKENGQKVEDAMCASLSRPPQKKPCKQAECLEWQTAEWSQCSQSCGQGVQHRHVQCPETNKCDLDVKPETQKLCDPGLCVKWITGPWGDCSVSCGGGQSLRNVQCVNTATSKISEGCDPSVQPTSSQACSTEQCPSDAAFKEKQAVCTKNTFSYKICKSLKRKGQCSNRYVKQKCCKTCHEKPVIEGDTGQTE